MGIRKEGLWPALLLVALSLVALLVAMAATGLIERPPAVRAYSLPGQFDAVRAKGRLAGLLKDQRPHPVDSSADDDVRRRLVDMLTALGLRPVVRDQFSCNALVKRRGVSCARVRNVIVAIGPSDGRAILLNAHYDSVPAGPGASDDGIGVATLVETASILRDRPLKRPIILLFNEGEERGLLGARAFLADPLSRNVSDLINLEARGVNGPVNMFETSRPNAAAVRLFADAAGAPVANSLATDVYRMLPNTTDVNSFAERGWLTFNFAPIGNETRYHSPGDDIAALDLSTLQHMGDQTLALAEKLANEGQINPNGEQIFMDVAAAGLIRMPLWLGAALLGCLLLSFLIASLRNHGLGRGAMIMVAAFLGSIALSWLAIALIGLAREGMFWRAHPALTELAAYSSSIVVGAVLVARSGRPMRLDQMRSAFWLFFLFLGAIMGLFAPGTISYFIIPPAIAALGLCTGRWWSKAALAGSAGAILFLYVTWGGMLGLLGELLANGPLWLFSPLGLLPIMPALIEASPLFRRAGSRPVSVIAGLVALIFWTIAASAPAYSNDRQQRFVIDHVTDALHQKSWWSVQNDGASLPPEFPGTWVQGKLPTGDFPQWLSPAPKDLTERPPDIHVVSQIKEGNERIIRLKLAASGNDTIALIAPADANIRAAGSPGFVRAIAAGNAGKFAISCFGRSCEGAILELRIEHEGPVRLTVIGSRPLNASIAAPLLAARPNHARAQYNRDEGIAFTLASL